MMFPEKVSCLMHPPTYGSCVHPPSMCQKRGGGVGVRNPKLFVYRKWPKSLFPLVDCIFSRYIDPGELEGGGMPPPLILWFSAGLIHPCTHPPTPPPPACPSTGVPNVWPRADFARGEGEKSGLVRRAICQGGPHLFVPNPPSPRHFWKRRLRRSAGGRPRICTSNKSAGPF